jgi:hypothetical protein
MHSLRCALIEIPDLSSWRVTGYPEVNHYIWITSCFPTHRPEPAIYLKLDSGTNVSFLFNIARYMPLELLQRTSLLGGGLDGAQHPYATMPLQDLQIGPLEIPRVSFFTFQDLNKDSSLTGDGMLSTGIFRRVFICHAHHFVVLDPR